MLTCAFGTDWLQHAGCLGCAQESARLQAEFESNVQAGVYDKFGYKPVEAKRRKPMQLELLSELA